MPGFVTLQPRGTDVIISALSLDRRFTREDLAESYGRLRLGRDGVLPPQWKQGISNELQRLGSDFSRFHVEGRKLDLIARIGRGQYCIRDEARPLLLKAANENSNLLLLRNTLLVPCEHVDSTESTNKFNHIVGAWAQQKLMQWVLQNGYTISHDTASTRSYDFTFIGRERSHAPQVMESKGTRYSESEIDVTLTPNEFTTWVANTNAYWLGIVYNIKLKDGQAYGGSDPFVAPPPIINTWKIVSGYRLRRYDQKDRQEEAARQA